MSLLKISSNVKDRRLALTTAHRTKATDKSDGLIHRFRVKGRFDLVAPSLKHARGDFNPRALFRRSNQFRSERFARL